DRQYPGVVALVLRKHAADFGHVLLHLGTDPNRKIERHRITIIEVAQDWKIHVAILPHFGGKFLAVRHNSHHARAQRFDARLRLHQRADADPAVWTPVPSVEGDHNRTLS